MAANPKYLAMLSEMEAMHNKKNEDYASAGNPYSNFEFAGAIGALFTDPVDIAFATLIGVKLARLGELRGKGKTPKNESVQDTFLDLSVYASLWASYYKEVPAAAEKDILIPAREGAALASARLIIPTEASMAQEYSLEVLRDSVVGIV
jgi:hypothetical protein